MTEKKLNSCKFSVTDNGSLYFRALNAKVEKATIDVNGTVLSIINPEYQVDHDIKEPVDLKFFGDKAFHRSLVYACNVNVILYTEEGTPSLMFGSTQEPVSWDTIHGTDNDDIYVEEVTVGSLNGPKTLKLCYTKNGCGYIK